MDFVYDTFTENNKLLNNDKTIYENDLDSTNKQYGDEKINFNSKEIDSYSGNNFNIFKRNLFRKKNEDEVRSQMRKFIEYMNQYFILKCGTADILNEPVIPSTLHERKERFYISYYTYIGDDYYSCEVNNDMVICPNNIEKNEYKIFLKKGVCFENGCYGYICDQIIDNSKCNINQYRSIEKEINCNPEDYPKEEIIGDRRIFYFCYDNKLYSFLEHINYYNCKKYQEQHPLNDKEKEELISIMNSLVSNCIGFNFSRIYDILILLVSDDMSIYNEAYKLYGCITPYTDDINFVGRLSEDITEIFESEYNSSLSNKNKNNNPANDNDTNNEGNLNNSNNDNESFINIIGSNSNNNNNDNKNNTDNNNTNTDTNTTNTTTNKDFSNFDIDYFGYTSANTNSNGASTINNIIGNIVDNDNNNNNNNSNNNNNNNNSNNNNNNNNNNNSNTNNNNSGSSNSSNSGS
ncbi:hypothetical protein PIROE2DRAFT_21501, partial [Piromyces sp. E2]